MDQMLKNKEIANDRLKLNYKKHSEAYNKGLSYLNKKGITNILPIFDGTNYYIYYKK